MEYGVFTSESLEIAQTRLWTVCLYRDDKKPVIGAKLYNGIDYDKTLFAVCERNLTENITAYAYETPGGEKFTNDNGGVCGLIGGAYEYDMAGLKKVDDIILSEPYEMPTAAGAGVENCLKQWRKGSFYNLTHDGMHFSMITNKLEYIFSIQNGNCNIYCGASVNIPFEGGMFGANQYFRLRNFGDNSQPFCRFYSRLGGDIEVPSFDKNVCESGECVTTPQGFYWPVKRCSDDEIVLFGCGGDEYVYRRDNQKSEYFL